MSKKKKNKFKKKQFNLREKISEYVHIVRDIKTKEYSLLYNYSQNKNAKIHSSKSLEEMEMAKEIFINSLILLIGFELNASIMHLRNDADKRADTSINGLEQTQNEPTFIQ